MKYREREAATNKQYQEILLWLDEKPDEFTPLKTANALSSLGCFIRMPTDFYSDNSEFLDKVIAFSEKYKADEKVLWHCLRALGEFGYLSTKKSCKKKCFNYLSRFRNHESKKIRYLVVWNMFDLFMPYLQTEENWFDYALSILSLPPRKEAFSRFSHMLRFNIALLDNKQLEAVVAAYEKFLRTNKNAFYQASYTRLVELLKQHIAGEIALTPETFLYFDEG
nr:hypothetical protein [uncultured Kingella sp.]